MIKSAMKENDGRAARRRYQRIGIAFGVLVVVIFSCVGQFGGTMTEESVSISRRTRGRHRGAGLQRREITRRGATSGNEKSQIEAFFGDERQGSRTAASDADEKSQIQAILRGERTLVNIATNSLKVNPDGTYSGLKGKFCQISWQKHKENPASTPMFRDVLAASPDCDAPTIDLATVVSRVRAYDADPSTEKVAHTLKIGGFVFHESRCGSTLVANLLQSANPQAHRVYSESPPPLGIFQAAQDFPPGAAKQAMLDVIFLMSRSNDAAETHVFFKIQSIGSRTLPVFTSAFPDIPWIFVFRDSEVLMSYFKNGADSPQRAHCSRQARNPPVQVIKKFREIGMLPREVRAEEYCAIHFATLTESALASLEAPGSQGRAVEYTQLPDIMWNTILPDMFHVSLKPADVSRMKETAGEYSKGRDNKAGTFAEDTARKQELAHQELKTAAQRMEGSYAKLKALSQGN